MGRTMSSFTIAVKETDLWIAVDEESYSESIKQKSVSCLNIIRNELEVYISRNQEFLYSLVPVEAAKNSPALVLGMASAARLAGVGPMAAVAGAISEAIAGYIKTLGAKEVIVENGGDIFIDSCRDITVGVYAGRSKFTGKLGVKIDPRTMPLAICTSSGTFGHSLSFGKADAVVVLAESGAVADAFATQMANQVIVINDIEKVVEQAKNNPLIKGIVAIKDDKLGVWGELELVSV